VKQSEKSLNMFAPESGEKKYRERMKKAKLRKNVDMLLEKIEFLRSCAINFGKFLYF
jgi:hypothetical protein